MCSHFREKLKTCRKCDNDACVLLQRRDPYCKDCLRQYCTHKFRSTVSKNYVLKHSDKVLIAYSGGMSSAALISLVHDTLSRTNETRKMFFRPSLVFVDGEMMARGLWHVLTDFEQNASIDATLSTTS